MVILERTVVIMSKVWVLSTFDRSDGDITYDPSVVGIYLDFNKALNDFKIASEQRIDPGDEVDLSKHGEVYVCNIENRDDEEDYVFSSVVLESKEINTETSEDIDFSDVCEYLENYNEEEDEDEE